MHSLLAELITQFTMAPASKSQVVRLSPQRADASELVAKPFLREPNSLIQARKQRYDQLMQCGCTTKQAWGIAFSHYPRKYLTEAELEALAVQD